MSIYALFRTRRAELRSHIDTKHIEQLKQDIERERQEAKLGKSSSHFARKVRKEEIVQPTGMDKMLPRLCLAGELYLHIIIGQMLAYQIGYYRMDTVLMLPLVELIIAVERFFPTVQRQCEVRYLTPIVLIRACYPSRSVR